MIASFRGTTAVIDPAAYVVDSAMLIGDVVAAGAVSTQQVGAGRFEPRDVARLAAQVQIEELEPVANER